AMHTQPRGARSFVFADLELGIESRGADPERLPRAAAERPSEAAHVTRHRHRSRGPLDNVPRLIEAESVDRRRRKIRFESNLSIVGRDPSLGEAARPGDHRVASPIDRSRSRPSPSLWHDNLDATGT